MLKELSGCLGRDVQREFPPADHLPEPAEVGGESGRDALPRLDSEGDLEDAYIQDRQSEAIKQATAQMVMVNALPEELDALQALGGRIHAMNSCRFRDFAKHSALQQANSLIRQWAEQEEIISGEALVPIRKRYHLRFFDERGFSLSLSQTLLLVINHKSAFLTAAEQLTFDSKVREANRVRKAAMKRTGALAPLEATLWGHPHIMSIVAKAQQAMFQTDGATAWKSSLFDGLWYEGPAFRDSSGQSLLDHRTDGPEMVRRLADLGGPRFEHSHPPEPVPPFFDFVPTPAAIAAPTSASGYRLRVFGAEVTDDLALRPDDPARDVLPQVEPKDVRIEALWRRRGSDRVVGDGVELAARSQRAAEDRFRLSLASEAQKLNAKMTPVFEHFTEVHDLQKSRCRSTSKAGCGEVTKAIQPIAPPAAVRRHVAPHPPQTVDEVAKLFLESDALKTVMDLEKNRSNRCASGWKSGYRSEPMSLEEIRSVRMVERAFQRSRPQSGTARELSRGRPNRK